MKRFSLLTILAVLALLVCCILPTHAEAATAGYYTYNVSGGKVTITDCSTSIRGNITIPSILGGYPVTTIGEQAFSDCSSLTSITIPNSVTSIGVDVFRGCSSLTSIWVDEKNSAYSSNDQGVLFNKNKTKLVCVPGSISGVYTIPNGVTSIGYGAFSCCSSLASITIPNSVTSIGNYAFANCTSMTSITIPNSVTSIGNGAFSSCRSLTHITIPNSVTSIGNYAFAYCSSLTSVTIGDSVTSIGNYAFYDCSSLTSIDIPAGVTSIGDYAFYNCSSLNHVAYTGTENQWNRISIKIYNNPLRNATRHYETALQTTEDCVAINVYCPVCQKTVTSIAKPNGSHAFSAATCTVCGKKSVDLKITAVTLRPEAAGLYFTGSFEIAENVAVKRQGIVVSVYSSMPVADGSDPNSLWSAGTTSVMVKNILRANLKDTSNQNRAAMPIYARAYVELEDGTYVYSNVSAVNLQEVVEAADGQWNTLDAIQKEAFLAMYKKFQAILQAWSIPNVKKV